MRPIETEARHTSTLAVLAFTGLVAACGGRIGQSDAPMPSTAPQPIDAGTLIEDAGTPQIYPPAPPDAASSTPNAATCGPSVAACFACTRTPGCDIQAIGAQCSGSLFYRLQDFLTYFSDLAMVNMLVVPAHGVDCTAQGQGACTYDPRTPQLSPSDVHYSNLEHEFIGPSGLHTIWMYKQDMNLWVVADREQDPELYNLVLGWVMCFPDGGP